MAFPIDPDLAPMEAEPRHELPEGPGWQYEPKWDGFRCLAFRDGEAIELRSKSGQGLQRYFPEVAAVLAGARPKRFALDGELVLAVGEGLSFEALQLRLHPAESRIRKLAAETPATYVVFDLLADARGRSLLAAPLETRRSALESFHTKLDTSDGIWLSPATRSAEAARRWLDGSGGQLDGIMAKRLDQPYRSGERAGMIKFKWLRTADCVVGGFRYGRKSDLVGSLLLGLYDEAGRLDHVGFTSMIRNAERPELTRRLEALVEPPGFTGRRPGGPSRWSTERSAEWQPLRPELVVEVRYDHVSDGRFRHGTRLLRWRPDKAPRQCTIAQIAPVADER